MIKQNNLYALLDVETLKKYNKTINWFVSHVEKLGASLIQYRNKTKNSNEKIDDVKLIKLLCDIPLIINDDISLVSYCDGLHLGQEDILKFGQTKKEAVENIRKIIDRKILGLSTHNEKEILEANALDIDYIGLGSYKHTSTKNVNFILGDKIDFLASLSNKNVAAIGGVQLSDTFRNISYIVVGSNLYEN